MESTSENKIEEANNSYEIIKAIGKMGIVFSVI